MSTNTLDQAITLFKAGDYAGALEISRAVLVDSTTSANARCYARRNVETIERLLAGNHNAAYPVSLLDGLGCPYVFDTPLSAAALNAMFPASYSVNGEAV